ncbi:hypothetical protein [Stomatohabitans albus]|uniref:hypothetical protein n=1 Tax=Stomatohabitans albus TaxID=3110766 RepID=UPI00300C226B
MEPDRNEDEIVDKSTMDPSHPTPPQGFPRVVAAYDQAEEDDELVQVMDEDPDTAEQDIDDAASADDAGPVFDSTYQPKRTPTKQTREVPFWAWLAIPVALVVGIIAVLVFRPVETLLPPGDDQTVAEPSTRADGTSSSERDSGDAPLPLTTPAPPGRFQAVGLAVFSGPDDIQINPGSVVTPDTRLTFRLSYNGAQLKDEVTVKWEVNDRSWGSETVHLNPWTTSQSFTRERPESGWPEGRYRLTVLHDDTEVSSIFFEVNPTGQPADPSTVTFPAEGEAEGGAGSSVEGSTSSSEFSFPGNSDSPAPSQ